MLLTTDMTKRCFSHPSVDVSTVVHLLRWRATHQPDRRGYTFLLDGETNEISITYAELDHQARNIAAQLQGMVTAGETVLLLYPPNIGYIAAFFGCLYAGAIAVPCYPPRRNRPNPSLPAIVADSQAKVALTTTAILSDLHRQLPYTPQFHMLHWLTTDTLDRDLAAGWKEPYLDPDMLAFLQYTSGSTGTPKGVMVSHGNLLHNEHMIACAFGHSDQTVVVGWLPLFHDMGLIGNVLQPLYLGVPCILMPSIAFLQKPYRWLQAISRYRATTSGGPNFAYDLCVRQISDEQRTSLDLSSWSVAFNGA